MINLQIMGLLAVGVPCGILGYRSGNPELMEEMAFGTRHAKALMHLFIFQQSGGSFYPSIVPSCPHQIAACTLALGSSQNACNFGLNLSFVKGYSCY